MAELPRPPLARGLSLLGVIGPGAIILGVSIGSGEWLLGLAVVWGLLALRLTQPIILLQLGANLAGLVLVITALHLLYLNTTLLPRELRPPLWRRIALVFLALFYGFFVYLWLLGGLVPNPEKGFLFNIARYLGLGS